MELDTSSIEKRFAYGFLQKLLKWMDIAMEFIAHLGTAGGEGYRSETVLLSDSVVFTETVESTVIHRLW